MHRMTAYIATCTAIVAVTILTIVAITNGLDGYVLSLALTILGGLGGYSIARQRGTDKSLEEIARALRKRPRRSHK